MTASFKLTLDTTPPVVEAAIDGGALVTGTQAVDLELKVLDTPPLAGYQYRVWGDVDPAANEHIQTEEEESDWLTYGELEEKLQALVLSEGDGNKTILVQVRDDVWNPAEVIELTIELNTTVPVITITAGPTPTKISNVATKNKSVFTFKANEDIIEWQTRLVPAEGSNHEAGVALESGGGSVVSGGEEEGEKNVEGKIFGSDFTGAAGGEDGKYIIKVFGKNEAGNWSV